MRTDITAPIKYKIIINRTDNTVLTQNGGKTCCSEMIIISRLFYSTGQITLK